MVAMTAQGSLLLSVVVTMVVLLLHSTASEAAQTPTGAHKNNDTEFIRRSCSSTLYPSLCYTSLSPYAGTIAQDPTRLALVATNVSLARVRSASSHVSSLRRASVDRRVENRTVNALKDCEESLGDAADLTGHAAGELGSLATAQGPEVAWLVNNAQTWMSAALTNEDTCVDGFAEVPPSATASGEDLVAAPAPPGLPSLEEDVCGRVRQAKQYTSNALALVNSLVGTNR
ncbi:hypothetical protein Taro_043620 [Colocasia esculenta]|uniref:Pectinesterase inhibitor domain-containing protein n=1 Tax=Colocasia esculenta TaxID=4460 RepID=A0A843X1V6_COLES|nr:hypothetical protein [Colocasia esculenta]